ncbi:TlpA family protein disulfide reductase [Panacibacter ginsenosidivorans]|uniref:TlpA family protein disulfide reductase n=1 Tax=Panacibacter ginsenosidivorans TaxID=1813871 RepID=A0A5B8V6W8_9BACT|nr:TlpA disulfide reductase family protein [Panacibacter ginsenosidivorans]QEC66969.1 TlpA family protein disulfide reductase [Panacibacter ginsenosidivorans]
MIHRRIALFILAALGLVSCGNNKNRQTEITLTIKGAAGKKVFLYREPFVNEVAVKVDSAIVVDLNHPVHFIIHDTLQRLYMLRVEQSGNRYYFINDVSALQINANEINGKYVISSSPASISLKAFNEKQSHISDSLRQYVKQMKAISKNKKALDSMKRVYDKKFAVFSQNYINYADTIQNGACFMTVYENIEFGNNYEKLKSFVDRASERFPDYKPIQELKSETYDMIDIFEKEYNVGDTLPHIALNNTAGQIFSTKSLEGKYYFIDFWATWCPQCLSYNYYKKQLWNSYKLKGLAMVSVALDDEKENWLNMLTKDSLTWTQLIDENMWHGTAVKTLKFDSIPFNFFVDPDGRVIGKAIKPDSLKPFIGRYLK